MTESEPMANIPLEESIVLVDDPVVKRVNVIWVRHGESCANRYHRLWEVKFGKRDPFLTDKGIAVSLLSGENLIYILKNNHHIERFSLFCSPLARTMETAKLMTKSLTPEEISNDGIIRTCLIQEHQSIVDQPNYYTGSRNTTSIFKSNIEAEIINVEFNDCPPILLNNQIPAAYRLRYLNLYDCGVNLETSAVWDTREESIERDIHSFLGYVEGDYEKAVNDFIPNLPNYNNPNHTNIFFSHGNYIRSHVIKHIQSEIGRKEDCNFNFSSPVQAERFREKLDCEKRMVDMIAHSHTFNNEAFFVEYQYNIDNECIGVKIKAIFEPYDIEFGDWEETWNEIVYEPDDLVGNVDLRRRKRLGRITKKNNNLSLSNERDIELELETDLTSPIHNCDYSFNDMIDRVDPSTKELWKIEESRFKGSWESMPDWKSVGEKIKMPEMPDWKSVGSMWSWSSK
jgi:hypothetical protein